MCQYLVVISLVYLVLLLNKSNSELYSTQCTVPDNSSVCCSWWFVHNASGHGCECGSSANGRVADNSAREVQLRGCNCMTESNDRSQTVVGACLYQCTFDNCLYKNSCESSNSSSTLCSQFNRQSQLCSQCKPGFALPAYSYALSCVNCTEYRWNWMKYIAVAYLPLTAFYFVVVALRINVTAASVDVLIIACQIISTPLATSLYYTKNTAAYNIYINIFISIVAVWNLDFFRQTYPLFCLNPKLSILHVLTLEYINAAYPLLLIFLTYAVIKLHDRGCIIIRLLCKPFHFCFIRTQQYLGRQYSLVTTFATFFFLSYCKVVSISAEILTPVYVYNKNGEHKLFLYLDASIEFMSKEHLPFAILASIFFLSTMFPVLLMFLYPCRRFQSVLNCCNLNFQSLHTFMDVFMGYYKDGTDGTRDCRYFAAVYLLLRILLVSSTILLSWPMISIFTCLVLLFGMLLLSLFQPYKIQRNNVINIIAISLLLQSSLTFVGCQVSICMNKVLVIPIIHLLVLSFSLQAMIYLCLIIYIWRKFFIKQLLSTRGFVVKYCYLLVQCFIPIPMTDDSEVNCETQHLIQSYSSESDSN